MRRAKRKEVVEKEEEIMQNIDEERPLNEEKMLNLIVDIIVQATLKEYYETCD